MPARNADQEKEILQWIEAVMGEPVPSGDFAEVSNHRNLQSAKSILHTTGGFTAWFTVCSRYPTSAEVLIEEVCSWASALATDCVLYWYLTTWFENVTLPGIEERRGALPAHEQDLAGLGQEVQDKRASLLAHGEHQRLSGE